MADSASGERTSRQVGAIRRMMGRVAGGGPRNVTAKGAKILRSKAGATRAGNLKTSATGRRIAGGLAGAKTRRRAKRV